MSTRLAILLLLLASITVEAQEYPDWFLFPDRYSPDIVVGYTYGSSDFFYDAIQNRAVFDGCIVKGRLEIFHVPGEDVFLRNSDYFYYYPPEYFDSLQTQLKLHSHYINDVFTESMIGLFSLADSLKKDPERLNVQALDRPGWIDSTFWYDDKYYYGVGEYTASGNINDAWKTAEEKSIFAILSSISLEYHKIRIQTDEEETDSIAEEVTVLKVYYRLRNIQIMQRWPDLERKHFYVLVKIAKTDLFTPSLN
jgi:hypothetical protein